MENPYEEEDTDDEEDPAIAEYRASGDADMAAAAKLAYKHELNILNNKATANEETNKLIKTALGDNHTLVPEFTDNDALTIKRPNNEYILAVRGTRPTNISDLISDEQILVGANVNRFDKVERVYTSLRKKKPNSKITVTGHSLGGYVAKSLADKYENVDPKLDMVGFDVAASPIHVGAQIAAAVAAPEIIPGLIVKGVADTVTHYVKNTLIGGSEYGKHRTYSTDTLDLISVMNNITNYKDSVKTLPQTVSKKQWFGSHSIDNYVLDKKKIAEKEMALPTAEGLTTSSRTDQKEIARRLSAKSVVVAQPLVRSTTITKTKQGNKTYYTSSHYNPSKKTEIKNRKQINKKM